MGNDLIWLYETQRPVFDRDCSLSFFSSVSDLSVFFAVGVTSQWEGLAKEGVCLYKDSLQVHGSNFQTCVFSSSSLFSHLLLLF